MKRVALPAAFLAVLMPSAAIPTIIFGQVDRDFVDIRLEVLPALNVTGIQNLELGQVLQGSGERRSSEAGAFAAWAIQDLPPSAQITITFLLPDALQHRRLAEPSIPLVFGPTSAELRDRAAVSLGVFDPAVGLNASGDLAAPLTVLIGHDPNGDGTGDVVLNVGSVPAGTYQASITMEVTILEAPGE